MWAWVTRTQPLQIQLFTDAEPLDAELTTLDPNLAQGDHVMVQWRGTNIIVLGKRYTAGESPSALTDDPADRRAEILAETEGIMEAAQARLDEVVQSLGALSGTTPPTEPDTEGRVYYQRDTEGEVVAVFRFTDGAWVSIPADDAIYVRVTTDQLVAGMALIGGTLIEDGGITAGKIHGDAFVGQTFTGGTFTGALFQTVMDAMRGVKLTGDGLHAWDATGAQTTRLNGIDNLLVGRFQTGRTGEPQLVIAPIYQSGNPSVFFSTDGGLSGTQAAIWLDTGNELTLRPNIAAGQNWVNIQGGGLKSKGTAAGSQWALSHIGEISGRSLSVTQAVRAASLASTGTSWSLDSAGTFTGLGVDVLGAVRAASLTSRNNNWAVLSNGNADFNTTKIWQALTVEGNANLNGNDIRMNSLPANTFNANVGWSSNPLGQLWRLTSNRRYKVNIEDLQWDEDALLSLRPRTWYDRALTVHHLGEEAITEDVAGPQADPSALTGTGMNRIPGLVAEEVEALGLTGLVTYDTDDEGGRTLSGVAYDRLAAALIPIIRRQRDRIAGLQDENEAMRSRLAAIEAHLGL